MRPDSELWRFVYSTRERAHTLRHFAGESRRRAEILVERARRLCARDHALQTQKSEPPFPSEPQVRHRFHARRLEIAEQLKQSLCDLESVRMVPRDDPELRELKEDIRRSISASTKA